MSDFENRFRELVQEVMKDVPVSVSADDVEGLEDFISEHKMGSVSAEDIDGLDDAVRDAVVDNFRNKLPLYVQQELNDTIDDRFLNALQNVDEVRNAIRKIVMEDIRSSVKQLVKLSLQELFRAS